MCVETLTLSLSLSLSLFFSLFPFLFPFLTSLTLLFLSIPSQPSLWTNPFDSVPSFPTLQSSSLDTLFFFLFFSLLFFFSLFCLLDSRFRMFEDEHLLEGGRCGSARA